MQRQNNSESYRKAFTERIQIKIDELATEPRQNGVKKLKDRENAYRIQVGASRILYKINVQAKNISHPWQKGDPIVEPQNVYYLPSGHLILSRECSQ